jgi:hypothetical protein
VPDQHGGSAVIDVDGGYVDVSDARGCATATAHAVATWSGVRCEAKREPLGLLAAYGWIRPVAAGFARMTRQPAVPLCDPPAEIQPGHT